ncbi:MAG: hypothetical protein KGH99_08330 [Thaumarchaeota archaeon]|nr:hypothetical protein [Nitrososphaerota archaeon]
MERLAQRKRNVKKGRNPKSLVKKPHLVSCYGFKINGILLSIPTGNRDKTLVILNGHPRGLAGDTMKWNVDTLIPLIRRADESKSSKERIIT